MLQHPGLHLGHLAAAAASGFAASPSDFLGKSINPPILNAQAPSAEFHYEDNLRRNQFKGWFFR